MRGMTAEAISAAKIKKTFKVLDPEAFELLTDKNQDIKYTIPYVRATRQMRISKHVYKLIMRNG